MTDKLIGTKPNQVPSNSDLGDLAYQNADFPMMNNLRLTGSMIIGDESTVSGNSSLGRSLTVPNGSSGDLFLFGPSPEIGFLDANADRSSAIVGNDGAIQFSSYSGANSSSVNAIIDGTAKASSPSNLMMQLTRVSRDSSGAYSSGGDLKLELGKMGIGATPTLPLDIMPDSSKRVFGSQQNQTQHGFCEYIISGTIGANAVTITMQCPSYFQAEVVATFQQSNGGSDNNVYFNGIWSNNHTTHLFKNKTDGGTVPRIGFLGNATPAFTVGVGDAASNSGKLVFTKPAATSTSGTYCIRVIAYGYSNAGMTYVVS